MTLFIEEGKIYQPLPEHPIYKDYPAIQPCIERWAMIEPLLPTSKHLRKALDLGCHTGWFARQLSARGFQVLAIEKNEEWVEVAKSIKAAGPEPEYVVGNLLEMEFPASDVALCLSVISYLFNDTSKGWAFLNRVSLASPRLFLDLGNTHPGFTMPFDRETISEQIIDHTAYSFARLLGDTALQRPLFLFSRG